MSFTSVKMFGEKASPSKVYYNATVVNNTVTTTNTEDDPLITFQDSRQSAVVLDVSKYNVSVENFTINGATKNLPVFIPQIDPTNAPNGNVNQTIYTITCAIYDGTNYLIDTQPIIWEPENKNPFTLVPTRNSPQLESDYYYCYTYTHWIVLVNKALRLAWSNIEDGTGVKCPFFTFNSTSGLFTLHQDANTCMAPFAFDIPHPYAIASAEVGYVAGSYSFVGMNTNLEGLLSNFNTTFWSNNATLWEAQPGIYLPEFTFDFGLDGLNTAASSADTIGILQNTQFLINPFTNGDLTTSFMAVTQDFVSTGTLWSPCAAIVITTTKIPIRNEFISNPLTIGDKNVGLQNASGSAFQKVLIETPINAVTSDIWRGWILYQPLTPTYSSMEDSQVALKELDFYAYWRNRLTGSLIPLRLYNSGTFSIRLLFDKKD